MLGGEWTVLWGGGAIYSTEDAKIIDSEIDMQVHTKTGCKQQSTHMRNNAYVIE